MMDINYGSYVVLSNVSFHGYDEHILRDSVHFAPISDSVHFASITKTHSMGKMIVSLR
jgi:hypothetical protein